MTPRERKSAAIVSRILQWYGQNARDLPWRRNQDPYAIWVSEIMLQQTQVAAVIPYWERWMRELPTLSALARASSGKVHKLWEGLGYYTRVRNMQRAAQDVVRQHEGVFPRKFEDVLALPGIGRYTAGAICSIAFNQPEPIVDGNVTRVLTRLFGVAADVREKSTKEELWQLAADLVLESSARKHGARACSRFNQGLMELGALVCTPRNPRCDLCPVSACCIAHRTRRVHALPRVAAKPGATRRRFFGFVVQKRGRFLVRQRPAGVVNAYLWELPNIEAVNGDSEFGPAARSLFGMIPTNLKALCSIEHSITRYRITFDVFGARLGPSESLIAPEGGRWVTRQTLQSLAFPSAHRKAIQTALSDLSLRTARARLRSIRAPSRAQAKAQRPNRVLIRT